MAAQHAIPELDERGLRDFGLTTGAIFGGLFGLLLPWLLDRPWPLWPWAIAAPLCILALVAPRALRPVYRYWMKFGLLASKVTTPIILGIVFYVVILPIGLFWRLRGRDELNRAFDPTRATYRVPSARHTPDKLEKPF